MMDAKQKLLAWLYSQLGYHESGDNNTKYADADYDTRLYGFDMHGQPWCDYFVDYAFIHCFGYDIGTAMTYQHPNGSAACRISAEYYKNNKAFFNRPEVGDQIFFYSGGDINHTGIVVEVTNATVTTIEGNSSDSVKKNTYYLTDNSIAGYGRPNWSLVEDEEEPLTELGQQTNLRTYFHLEKGDGMNDPKPQVKAWQIFLNAWGYGIEPDGEFGDLTHAATTMWQKKCKEVYGGDVEVNGIVDEDDWLEIVKVPI